MFSAALYAHVQLPLAQSHMRPRVQRASGIPCALWLERAKRNWKPRAKWAARLRTYIRVVPAKAGTHTPRPLLLKKRWSRPS